jgi:hypothetical protein
MIAAQNLNWFLMFSNQILRWKISVGLIRVSVLLNWQQQTIKKSSMKRVTLEAVSQSSLTVPSSSSGKSRRAPKQLLLRSYCLLPNHPQATLNCTTKPSFSHPHFLKLRAHDQRHRPLLIWPNLNFYRQSNTIFLWSDHRIRKTSKLVTNQNLVDHLSDLLIQPMSPAL